MSKRQKEATFGHLSSSGAGGGACRWLSYRVWIGPGPGRSGTATVGRVEPVVSRHTHVRAPARARHVNEGLAIAIADRSATACLAYLVARNPLRADA